MIAALKTELIYTDRVFCGALINCFSALFMLKISEI